MASNNSSKETPICFKPKPTKPLGFWWRILTPPSSPLLFKLKLYLSRFFTFLAAVASSINAYGDDRINELLNLSEHGDSKELSLLFEEPSQIMTGTSIYGFIHNRSHNIQLSIDKSLNDQKELEESLNQKLFSGANIESERLKKLSLILSIDLAEQLEKAISPLLRFIERANSPPIIRSHTRFIGDEVGNQILRELQNLRSNAYRFQFPQTRLILGFRGKLIENSIDASAVSVDRFFVSLGPTGMLADDLNKRFSLPAMIVEAQDTFRTRFFLIKAVGTESFVGRLNQDAALSAVDQGNSNYHKFILCASGPDIDLYNAHLETVLVRLFSEPDKRASNRKFVFDAHKGHPISRSDAIDIASRLTSEPAKSLVSKIGELFRSETDNPREKLKEIHAARTRVLRSIPKGSHNFLRSEWLRDVSFQYSHVGGITIVDGALAFDIIDELSKYFSVTKPVVTMTELQVARWTSEIKKLTTDGWERWNGAAQILPELPSDPFLARGKVLDSGIIEAARSRHGQLGDAASSRGDPEKTFYHLGVFTALDILSGRGLHPSHLYGLDSDAVSEAKRIIAEAELPPYPEGYQKSEEWKRYQEQLLNYEKLKIEIHARVISTFEWKKKMALSELQYLKTALSSTIAPSSKESVPQGGGKDGKKIVTLLPWLLD